jgi:hypothetical protein
MIWLRDHGSLVDLADERWILQLEDAADLLEFAFAILQLVLHQFVAERDMIIDLVSVSHFED